MTVEEQIKDTLVRLMDGIKGHGGAAISASLAEADSLLKERRGRIDPRLEHFLEKRSYSKALAWFERNTEFGRAQTPTGGCRR